MQDDGTYAIINSDYSYNDTTIINKFIAFKNPFRYRSYYYDFETNLYYLNSRYYDPQLGRFINADDVANLFNDFNGLNLYVYCVNNPVKNIDTLGYFPISIRVLNKMFAKSNNKKFAINIEIEKSWSLHKGILKYLLINIEYTMSISNESPEMFYTYTSLGNGNITNGIGINLYDSFGVSLYYSSDVSVGVQLQYEQTHFGVSLGLDGIGFNFGLSIGNITHDINVNISWTTVALTTTLALLPVPGSRVVAFFVFLFDLIF